MKRVPAWFKEVLAIIAIVFLAAQSAFAVSMLDRLDNDPYLYRQVTKRQHHDPWGLCPAEMPSVNCFYIYLRVYARLRREGATAAPDRMVGKRSHFFGSSMPVRSLMPPAQPAVSESLTDLLLDFEDSRSGI